MNKRLKNMVISYKASDNRAITLIALVITIVIMIILASISIQAITNTGLIGKAKRARDDTNYAAAAEKVALAVSSSYNNYGEQDNGLLTENINNIKGLDKKIDEITDDSYTIEIIVDGFKFQISKDWSITGEKKQVATLPENTKNTTAGTPVKTPDNWNSQVVNYIKTSDGTKVTTLETVATVYAISAGDGNTVPVPKDFYYVGGTLDTGVVISDNPDDQNKFAGVANVPSGAVYDATTGKVKTSNLTDDEKSKVIYGNQFVWIPCTNGDYTKYSWGYSNNSWDNSTNSAERTQIQKYGGFYVGRYEAGTSKITFSGNYTLESPTGTSGWVNGNYTSSKVTKGEITTKPGEIPYYHADYTTAVAMSEGMYNTNSVNSGLMTGTQWDVMLNYMSDEKNKSLTNASNANNYTDLKANSYWGNYNADNGNVKFTVGQGRYIAVNSSNGIESGSFTVADSSYHYGIRTTGSTDSFRKRNLYDVAGNLWEWTEESVSSSSYYMLRGGCFLHAFASHPACYRAYDAASNTSADFGFRPALYIK